MPTLRVVCLLPLIVVFCRTSATAQQLPTAVEIEFLHVVPQYEEESDLDAAREPERNRVECSVEFEDGSEVDEVMLVLDGDRFPLERRGDLFQGVDHDPASSAGPNSDVEIEVTPIGGSLYRIEVEAGITPQPDSPEIRFPMDGLDEIDVSDVEAQWTGSGDESRIDLFELLEAPDEPIVVFRAGGLDADLRPFVSSSRAYELWVGLTELNQEQTDEGVEITVRVTEGRSVRFAVGPSPREEIGDYGPGDQIDFAWAGRISRRYGQFRSEIEELGLALVSGPEVDDAESGRIEGLDDGRVVGGLDRLARGGQSEVYFRESTEYSDGDVVLLLAEFQSGRIGSEVRVVGSPLQEYPEILPLQWISKGSGPELVVEWDFIGESSRFLLLIRSAGGELLRCQLAGGTERSSLVEGAASAGGEFSLEVAALDGSGGGSSSVVGFSTAISGDANGDGAITGFDLFGYAAAWFTRAAPARSGFVPLSVRLDRNRDEWVSVQDLVE